MKAISIGLKSALLAVCIGFAFFGIVSQSQSVPPELYARQVPILTNATATGAGAAVRMASGAKTYQASGTVASGTGSAVVNVEGSNNGATFDLIATMSVPLGTATTSMSFPSLDRYVFTRGNVTTLTGSTATVSLSASY